MRIEVRAEPRSWLGGLTGGPRSDALLLLVPQNKHLIKGSGYIAFPPQRPFQQPVVVQPPTVAVRARNLLGPWCPTTTLLSPAPPAPASPASRACTHACARSLSRRHQQYEAFPTVVPPRVTAPQAHYAPVAPPLPAAPYPSYAGQPQQAYGQVCLRARLLWTQPPQGGIEGSCRLTVRSVCALPGAATCVRPRPWQRRPARPPAARSGTVWRAAAAAGAPSWQLLSTCCAPAGAHALARGGAAAQESNARRRGRLAGAAGGEPGCPPSAVFPHRRLRRRRRRQVRLSEKARAQEAA